MELEAIPPLDPLARLSVFTPIVLLVPTFSSDTDPLPESAKVSLPTKLDRVIIPDETVFNVLFNFYFYSSSSFSFPFFVLFSYI